MWTPLLEAPPRNDIPFKRACHSSSSTTSKRVTLLRMAGTNSAQFGLAGGLAADVEDGLLVSVSAAAVANASA